MVADIKKEEVNGPVVQALTAVGAVSGLLSCVFEDVTTLGRLKVLAPSVSSYQLRKQTRKNQKKKKIGV